MWCLLQPHDRSTKKRSVHLDVLMITPRGGRDVSRRQSTQAVLTARANAVGRRGTPGRGPRAQVNNGAGNRSFSLCRSIGGTSLRLIDHGTVVSLLRAADTLQKGCPRAEPSCGRRSVSQNDQASHAWSFCEADRPAAARFVRHRHVVNRPQGPINVTMRKQEGRLVVGNTSWHAFAQRGPTTQRYRRQGPLNNPERNGCV